MYHTLLLYDAIEILLYSFIVYTFCIWLYADTSKNILVYFLVYCFVALTSWFIHMPTLASTLFSYAPLTLMIFVLLHERTLQRNFVALNNISSSPIIDREDWLDTLLAISLTAINNNKSITIIIENKDSLEHFLKTPLLMNSALSKETLTILLNSNIYDETKMIWANTQGYLHGINALWNQNVQKSSINQLHQDKQNALFYTLQNDALIIHTNPTTRTFSLICNGKEIDTIGINSIKNSINVSIKNSTSLNEKRHVHEKSSRQKTIS